MGITFWQPLRVIPGTPEPTTSVSLCCISFGLHLAYKEALFTRIRHGEFQNASHHNAKKGYSND